MIRHGSSHGLAVLICTLASGFLIATLRAFLPDLLSVFSKGCIFLCSFLALPYPPKSVELILIAAVMASIWGAAFSFIHGSKQGRGVNRVAS